MIPIPSSEITPEKTFLTRRQFLSRAGLAALAAVLAACQPRPTPTPSSQPTPAAQDELTTLEKATGYTNFYEFATDKSSPARLAQRFKVKPWEIQVIGLVQKPRTFALEDLLKQFPSKEHIYRLRCVEGWSMVIPWLGFSLAELLKEVEPMSSARFVQFDSVYRPAEMPGQNDMSFPWPYSEGLRLDEALHPLTLLASGMYGKDLPPQNGAPLRLVVPWKYGFKSIKSIVRIELTEKQPPTFWSTFNALEYGFFANVNPQVDHRRWSQKSEVRVGENQPRPTLLFNGYADQVAGLYAGMDLVKFY